MLDWVQLQALKKVLNAQYEGRIRVFPGGSRVQYGIKGRARYLETQWTRMVKVFHWCIVVLEANRIPLGPGKNFKH